MNKLLAIQTELKAPKGQLNKFGGYHYRSCEDILEALKPLLAKHGVTFYLDDEMMMMGNRFYVKTTAKFIDGDLVTTAHGWAREEETKKGMDGSQITGAASSYARKYALNALFLIDDTKDADATNDHGKAEQRPAEAPVEPKEQPRGVIASAVTKTFTATPEQSMTGKVASHLPPKEGQEWHKYRMSANKDILLSTKDPAIVETLNNFGKLKKECVVFFTHTKKGEWDNYYISRVTEAEALPF